MKHEEDRLQIACRTWFDLQYPHLRLLLHHSPNEGRLVNSLVGGAKRKAMGVRAGFPDFILLKPSHGYAYLAIELKAPHGRQSPSQRDYQAAVEREGGCYIICRSIDDFRREVTSYLTEE